MMTWRKRTVDQVLAAAVAVLVMAGAPIATAAADVGEPAALPQGGAATGTGFNAFVPNQFNEFLFAGAAAEACQGVRLSATQRNRFVEFLSIRDPQRRPLPVLADYVRSRLKELRDQINRSGCHTASVQQALLTWNLRVTLLAGIQDQSSSAVREAGSKAVGPEAFALRPGPTARPRG